jgi:hypothetical protein
MDIYNRRSLQGLDNTEIEFRPIGPATQTLSEGGDNGPPSLVRVSGRPAAARRAQGLAADLS